MFIPNETHLPWMLDVGLAGWLCRLVGGVVALVSMCGDTAAIKQPPEGVYSPASGLLCPQLAALLFATQVHAATKAETAHQATGPSHRTY